MSYQIQYSPEFSKYYPSRHKQKRPLLPVLAVLSAVMIVYILHQTNLIGVQTSGEEIEAVAVFSELISNVESGTSVRESLLAFCRELIQKTP